VITLFVGVPAAAFRSSAGEVKPRRVSLCRLIFLTSCFFIAVLAGPGVDPELHAQIRGTF
jgi:hypothetical protein